MLPGEAVSEQASPELRGVVGRGRRGGGLPKVFEEVPKKGARDGD